LAEFSPFLAIVYFGQRFENYRSRTNLWATFSPRGTSYVAILAKTLVGLHFGRLFHETHPVTLVGVLQLIVRQKKAPA
jgi:hypothetical protein